MADKLPLRKPTPWPGLAKPVLIFFSLNALLPSRERARALILAGRVLVNEQKIDKPGTAIAPDSTIRLLGDDMPYVSRGGLKLQAALDHWNIEVSGRACLDIGASTGGFY